MTGGELIIHVERFDIYLQTPKSVIGGELIIHVEWFDIYLQTLTSMA